MTKAEAKKAALAFVNAVRVSKGMLPIERLPKGRPRDSSRCPISLATGYECDGFDLWEPPPLSLAPKVELPDAVIAFAQKFDDGKYAELIEEGQSA